MFFHYRNPCPTGRYSLGKQQSCTVCPAGKYCPTSSSEPINCQTGYFSFGEQFNCTQCEAGYECSDPTGKFFVFSCTIRII